MNYIYDLFINLYKYPVDFFEWDVNSVVNVVKTPLFKYENICKIKNFYFKIDNDFLNKIKNKGSIKNSCILTNDKESIFLVLDDFGYIKFKSKLVFSEEEEVIKYCEVLDTIDINIEFIKNDNYNFLITKKCNEEKNIIIKKLNNTSVSKMKYIYYECFNKLTNDVDIIKKTLLNNYDKIYNLL